MQIAGDDAKGYDAVRLDNFHPANDGELVSADETTGAVSWRDAAGETKHLTLGPRMIRILPRSRYAR